MSSVRERLAAFCQEAEAGLGPTREEVAAIRERLEEPTLRLAVGGRLNAGKSTLVNVLLGQHLAATDATECTRVVSWFRYYPSNRVEVRLRDGSRRLIPATPGGGLPASLGTPIDQVASVVVEASNTGLRNSHTVIDTPGLDSLSGLDGDSLTALAQADALLYVMPLPGERDRDTLEALRAALGGSRLSAANVVGVLSRIDQLGSGVGDPWTQARKTAARYAGNLRTLVADVIPVAGLLAETAIGERYTETDTRNLRELAAVDQASRQRWLYSAEHFLRWEDGPLGTADRQRLLGLLGMYGLGEAITAIADGQRGTAALLSHLRERSGIDPLLAYLRDNVTKHADRLRAASALDRLDHITAAHADGANPALARLRAQLAQLRQDPTMRQAELASALADLNAGRYRLDEDDEAALVALATGGDPASQLRLPPDAAAGDIAARASAENDRWRTLAGRPSRVLAQHAEVARGMCQALYFAAADGS